MCPTGRRLRERRVRPALRPERDRPLPARPGVRERGLHPQGVRREALRRRRDLQRRGQVRRPLRRRHLPQRAPPARRACAPTATPGATARRAPSAGCTSASPTPATTVSCEAGSYCRAGTCVKACPSQLRQRPALPGRRLRRRPLRHRHLRRRTTTATRTTGCASRRAAPGVQCMLGMVCVRSTGTLRAEPLRGHALPAGRLLPGAARRHRPVRARSHGARHRHQPVGGRRRPEQLHLPPG